MDNESNFNSKNTGILLISHGSRHPLASETFNKISKMFREKSDFKVNVGYMEIHEPNIPSAFDDLVKDTEIDTVIAVPVFLAHGMHTTRDIPEILGLNSEKKEESKEHYDHNHNHDHKHEHHDSKHHDHENGQGHGHHHYHHHHNLEKINFDGKIIYTEPLGADPLVIEIIKNRVNTALKG